MLSKYQMRSILQYLDRAMNDIAKTEVPGFESNAAWNIRMARQDLYSAALGDIEVERLAAAEAEAA